MSEFKKLFQVKRILAMILAVAMTVTSLPAVTANAASLDGQPETEQDVDGTPADDNADDSQTIDVLPSDETGEQEGVPDVKEESAEDALALENTEESGTTEPAVPGENGRATGDKEYTFSFSEDFAEYTTGVYNQGEPLFAEETEAAEGVEAGMTINDYILNRIELQNTEDDSESYNLNAGSDIVRALTYSWKQDGKDLAKGTSPKEAGSYQLVIRLDAKEGEYKAAETTIDFRITRARIDIDYEVSEVNPGDPVSAVVLEYASAEASDGRSFIYGIDDKDTAENEAADNEVLFELAVREAATNNELKSEEKLVNGKEYVVNVVPKFTGKDAQAHEKNYEFNQPAEKKINVKDLVKTRVRLTLASEYNTDAKYKKESSVSAKDPEQTVDKITMKSYDGNAVSGEPKYTAKVGVPGVDKDGKDTFTEIAGSVTKGAWHSAVYQSWTEGETRYCNLTVGGELENAPVDAGTYVYRVTYEGDREIYAASSADIVVEIEAVSLIIRPGFGSERKSFYSGQTAADVLAETIYELPFADREGKFTIPEDQKDSFWGTSFVNTTKTQPYEPVFEVVKTTVVTDKDGKETSETEVLEPNDKLVYDKEGKTTYKVRFTGYKAVYDDDGRENGRKSINDPANSTSNNYIVKTDEDTLEQNTVSFDVVNVNAVIDTSKITADFTTNQDFHNAAYKTYDGKGLFNNRSGYKQAWLTSGGTKVEDVLNTDLTYKWYRSRYSTIMDTRVMGEDGKFTERGEFYDSFYSVNLISPVNAGIYKLVITYEDKEDQYFAEPAELYFVIEKQTLQIKLTNKVYEEFDGITVGQFLEDAEIEYSIEPGLTDPTTGEDWKEEGTVSDSYPYIYNITWQVEEKQRDADGNAIKDENGKDQYEPLQNYESFVYDEKNAADSYRLSVRSFTCNNSNFTVSETIIEDVKDPGDPDAAVTQRKVTTNLSVRDDNTAAITVNQMGTTRIHLNLEAVIEKKKDYDGESIYNVLKEDLAKLKVVKDNEDGTTTEVNDVSLTYMFTDHESNETYEMAGLTEAEFIQWAQSDQMINGGDYTITAQYRGDKTYAPMSVTTVANVTVNKIPLTITPPTLEDSIVAGTGAYTVMQNANSAFGTANIEGYLERDEQFFTLSLLSYTQYGQSYPLGYGYSAWFYDDGEGDYNYMPPSFRIQDKNEQTVLDESEVLKGEAEDRYKLILEDDTIGELSGICARNYNPVRGEGTSIATRRGNSVLRVTEWENIRDVDATDSVTDMTHKFTVLDGIQYTSFNGKEGNFIAVQIVAPQEYGEDICDQAIYKASIEKAGGEIVYAADNVITVVFDAGKGAVTFGIRWEKDYIETFELAFDAEKDCLGNLDEAVSPASIAFNAPNKTMVVGATQNLDVRITKVQKDDIICLGYKVEEGGEKYLSVNEYGKVTALSPGSGTVTVYPMHLVDGVKVPIEDSKAKKASVKITVRNVAAPKITKATPLDYNVTVWYPYVSDVDYNYGYRREIYVLEGKNLKEKDFTEKIDSMVNEQWEGIFAAEPVFLDNNREWNARVYDSKKHAYINTVEQKITGLKPNTDYTVYVRNVSAIRTLSDGSLVVSSAAGSVKGFRTTLSQVKDLELTLKDHEDTDNSYEGSSLVYEEYNNVQLSEGSLQLNINGYFEAWAMDPYAEPLDDKGYFDIDHTIQPLSLALGKDYKKYYVDPKISYYFWTYADREGCYDAYTGEEAMPGEYYRSTSSALASVSKKGKITLKQPGWIEIVAVDTTTGIWSNQVNIKINAEADTVKGKTVTLQVGQSIPLENLVEYREGNKVLDQSFYTTVDRIDRTGLKAGIEEGGYFTLSDNGYVTAVKGKGNIRLTLQDKVLKQPVQVTLKSTALASVKNLKVIDVIDNRFTVQFERNPYAEAYRIDVKNARGTLIRSVYVEDYKVDGLYDGDSIYDDDTDWDDDWYQGNWHCYYDHNTGKTYGEYTVRDLTQQSKYTVTVQALYKESDPSKAVSKTVTTTKLPASENKLGKYDINTGIRLYVWKYEGYTINAHPFVSGNNYTLVAEPDNRGAKYAATDTLTWSSTNKSVATIKANAGSYSAALKAVKAGTTNIEVKSKVTKNVIARYRITVKTVGDAYGTNLYYGDNEDLRGDGTEDRSVYTELTLGNPAAVDLASGQSKTFVFKAPEDGTYLIYRVQNGNKELRRSQEAKKDETITYTEYLTGSYSVVVEKQKDAGLSDRTPLETGAVTMRVIYGQYFVFTAEGDGIYSFDGLNFTVEDTEGNEKTSGSPAQCWLEDGETVYLCANGSGQRTITVKKIPMQSLTADAEASLVSTDNNGDAWFSFTAPKAAEYEFVLSKDSWGWKYISLHNCSDLSGAIEDEYGYESDIKISGVMLGAGTTVLVKAYPSGSTLAVRTTAPIEPVTTGESKNVTLSDTNIFLEFVAPADGFYQFSSTGAGNAEAALYKDLTGSPVDSQTVYNGDFTVACYLKSGQHGYLKVTSYDGSQQENVAIKAESLTPEKIEGTEVKSEIVSSSYKWFSFTANAKDKYTFTFTGDGYGCTANLYTLSALSADRLTSVKDLSLSNGKKHFDYEMDADQTVYWRVKNYNSSGSINVTVKAEKYTIPALAEGSSETFDIEAGDTQIVTFTAADAGKYTFKFKNSGYSYCSAELYGDADLSNYIDSISFDYDGSEYAYNAKKGEKLYWKLSSPYSDITVTVGVEKFIINPLKEGENPSELKSDFSKYFSFTAPEGGDYIFAFASDSNYGYAYKYPDMYFENWNDYKYFSSRYGTVSCSLSAQETVYWELKSSFDMNVTILVKKDVPVEIKADTEPTEVVNGLDQWFSFTADENEDARYRFTFTIDSNYASAYFYRDRDGSSEGSSVSISSSPTATSEKYIEAGETVYWKTLYYNSEPANVTVKAEKIPVTAVTEDETASIPVSSNASQILAISLPESDAEYVITMISETASCSVQLYSDLSMNEQIEYQNVSAGGSGNLTVPGNGGKVYLKVTNNDYVNDTRFKVSVKKLTEEIIAADSSPVTIAPGAEQWFIFTPDADAKYTFTLKSDAETCGWYLYKDDESSYLDYSTSTTESVTNEYYIPKGTSMRWKVKNQSIQNDTNVTLTANTVEIQPIADDMKAAEIDPGSSKWFSYTAESEGRYGFTFTNTVSSCQVTPYSTLDDKPLEGFNSFSIYSSNIDRECYLSESQTIYFKVKNNNSSTKTEFKIIPEEYTVGNVSTDSTGTINTTTAQWFKFTASEAGVYSFNTRDNDSTTNSIQRGLELYKDLKDTEPLNNMVNSSTSREYHMDANESLYLKVSSRDGSNVTGTLNVVQLTVAELNQGTEVVISLSYNLAQSMGVAKFTASEAGIYSFEPVLGTDSTARGTLYLYTDMNGSDRVQSVVPDSSSGYQNGLYPLLKGDVIYVVVAGNDEQSELKMKVNKEQAMEEIETDQDNSLTLTENEAKWICFRSDSKYWQYYMNASGSTDTSLTIKYKSLYGGTPYINSTWMTNMSSATKNLTFTDLSLSTQYVEAPFCICITSDQDVTLEYSVSTSRQN